MVTLDFEPKEIFVCVYHDIIFISLHNFTIREGKKYVYRDDLTVQLSTSMS